MQSMRSTTVYVLCLSYKSGRSIDKTSHHSFTSHHQNRDEERGGAGQGGVCLSSIDLLYPVWSPCPAVPCPALSLARRSLKRGGGLVQVWRGGSEVS